jgi:hypothetical protein
VLLALVGSRQQPDRTGMWCWQAMQACDLPRCRALVSQLGAADGTVTAAPVEGLAADVRETGHPFAVRSPPKNLRFAALQALSAQVHEGVAKTSRTALEAGSLSRVSETDREKWPRTRSLGAACAIPGLKGGAAQSSGRPACG